MSSANEGAREQAGDRGGWSSVVAESGNVSLAASFLSTARSKAGEVKQLALHPTHRTPHRIPPRIIPNTRYLPQAVRPSRIIRERARERSRESARVLLEQPSGAGRNALHVRWGKLDRLICGESGHGKEQSRREGGDRAGTREFEKRSLISYNSSVRLTSCFHLQSSELTAHRPLLERSRAEKREVRRRAPLPFSLFPISLLSSHANSFQDNPPYPTHY